MELFGKLKNYSAEKEPSKTHREYFLVKVLQI